MSFEPIQTDCRRSLGVRMGYVVKQPTPSTGGRLRFSIAPDYVIKMGWKDGEFLRLDVDPENGLARFLTVMALGKAARRLEIRTRSTGRGHFEIPWSGDVPSHFPAVAEMTELNVVETRSGEGLVFELPKQKGGKS